MFADSQRWSEEKANSWYQQQPWLVGSNFIPATAINELEMWQAATFDPQEIDKELGWAQSLGMNTMRVFLHDLLWQQDAAGFKQRIDTFLTISAKHKIRPVFVLFDSCWDPFPKLGPQHPPIPGVHNSGWVQSPGAAALQDPAQYPRLKEYVQGVVGAFANDPRMLAWDLWNEPNNGNGSAYGAVELKKKTELVLACCPRFSPGRVRPIRRSRSPAESGRAIGRHRKSCLPTAAHSTGTVRRNFFSQLWLAGRLRKEDGMAGAISPADFVHRVHGPSHGKYFRLDPADREKAACGGDQLGIGCGKDADLSALGLLAKALRLEKPPVWFHEVFHQDGKPYREAGSQDHPRADGREVTTVRVGRAPSPAAFDLDLAVSYS